MKIIDTHTHFYDPFRPQGVPWPGEKDDLIYRTVLPEHHREVAAASGVVGTVVSAASVWPDDNQWVLDLVTPDDPWVLGVTGHISSDDDFCSNVDRLAANPYYRGIRAGAEFVDDGDGRALQRVEKMAEHDLQVDICGTTDRPDDVCSLARRVPELRWVLNHCGEPSIDGEKPDPAWVDYIRAVGEDGLIFGSNWPVCDMNSDHDTVLAIVRSFFEPKGEAVLEKY